MIINYSYYKVLDEIIYPSSNINGCTVEVPDLIDNFM